MSTLSTPGLAQQIANGAPAGRWTLDPHQSSIGLKSKSVWGLMGIRGTFTGVSGDGVLGSDGGATGTVTIAAASIDTKNAKRDTHLKSKDFLYVEDHPDIVVTVSSIRTAGDTMAVEGALTVVGKTIPLSFPATATVTGNTAVLDATLTIDRSELGLTWNQIGMVSMKNDITVHFVFAHV